MNREGSSNNNVNALAKLMAGTAVSENPTTHKPPKYVRRFTRRGRGSKKFTLGRRTFKFVPNYIKTRRRM